MSIGHVGMSNDKTGGADTNVRLQRRRPRQQQWRRIGERQTTDEVGHRTHLSNAYENLSNESLGLKQFALRESNRPTDPHKAVLE